MDDALHHAVTSRESTGSEENVLRSRSASGSRLYRRVKINTIVQAPPATMCARGLGFPTRVVLRVAAFLHLDPAAGRSVPCACDLRPADTIRHGAQRSAADEFGVLRQDAARRIGRPRLPGCASSREFAVRSALGAAASRAKAERPSSCTPIFDPDRVSAARCTRFSSSRTLPGQGCSRMARRVVASSASGPRPCFLR